MTSPRKFPHIIGQPTVRHTLKDLGKVVLDESRTIVSSGENFVKSPLTKSHDLSSISCDLGSGVDDSDEVSVTEESEIEGGVAVGDTNFTLEEKKTENANQSTDPSFGDLIRINAPEPISVTDNFGDDDSCAKNYLMSNIKPPPGTSLGAVLAQALRTNDIHLLESCLHTSDVNTIRATITRLESSQAAKLLQKLAERLHKRPGRAGSMMVWVQWTLIAHGGFLATQRGLVHSLVELSNVIDQRSRGLQSVLLLKGKLDMLEAQLELRRSFQDHRRRVVEEGVEDSIIYVEGQENGESEIKSNFKNSMNENLNSISHEKGELSNEILIKNGIITDSEDDQEDSSDYDKLIDDEAEEIDDDLTGEEEVDFEDSIDDGEDSDGAPLPKMAKFQEQPFQNE